VPEERRQGVLRKAYAVVNGVDTVLGLIAGICILIITAITLYEIIARYIFHRPPFWAFDISSYLLLVVAVFSGVYAMANDGHVRFTMVVDKLRLKTRRKVMFVGLVLGLAYCVLLFQQAIKLGIMAVQRNIYTHMQIRIPDIYLYLVIIIGAFFLCLTFLGKAIMETFSGERPTHTDAEY